jgi:hypothetical protein
VFPLPKLALSNVYAKIGGKAETHAKIFVNKAVVHDLEWFISHVHSSDGVCLFENVNWDVRQVDITAYSDACLSGLGFFLERSREGFQCEIPQEAPRDTIFYFEALAVVSVVDAVLKWATVPSQLLIYSNNTNTVNIFHSLHALSPYNDHLKFTVSLLLKHNISLRVVHIAGVAVDACPDLSISTFQPPRLEMGHDL